MPLTKDEYDKLKTGLQVLPKVVLNGEPFVNAQATIALLYQHLEPGVASGGVFHPETTASNPPAGPPIARPT